MKKKINYEIAQRIISKMPIAKKEMLIKQLLRNVSLTSNFFLSDGDLTIYKEGFYLVLKGVRCRFSVFAKDIDGELVFTRKPKRTLLHEIYNQDLKLNEEFYDVLFKK